ncbi:hypothetical protein niasHT_009952 [Heterodera trifolii]|uniref:Uncharacterized protein n=1 Tax=Heterodera trifolii TaxID=157864 RepID=A0ABD2LQH3_9BILA
MTINRILAGNTKTREHYLGCFPCDKLPNKINKYPSALVANNDPSNKEGTHWIAMFIVDDKTVYYFDSFGLIPNRYFQYDGITKESARKQMAYNGFKNVTVDQHFYVRHRICLRYANNPCVIEKHRNGHERFYPLELVKARPGNSSGVKEQHLAPRKSESGPS